MVPEPRGPLLETFDLTRWYVIPKPKYFVAFKRDLSLVTANSPQVWLQFADRLNHTDLAGTSSKACPCAFHHFPLLHFLLPSLSFPEFQKKPMAAPV